MLKYYWLSWCSKTQKSYNKKYSVPRKHTRKNLRISRRLANSIWIYFLSYRIPRFFSYKKHIPGSTISWQDYKLTYWIIMLQQYIIILLIQNIKINIFHNYCYNISNKILKFQYCSNIAVIFIFNKILRTIKILLQYWLQGCAVWMYTVQHNSPPWFLKKSFDS